MKKLGLDVDVADGLILIGLVALLYGVSRWSVPAAWVIGGLYLMVAGGMAVVAEKRKR